MKLIFLFGLLISLNANAQSAAERFDADLSAHIKQFKKQIQIYHYFPAPTVPSTPADNTTLPQKLHPQLDRKVTRDQWTNYYMSVRSGAFWDLGNHNTNFNNAGPGIYLALDPSSSREFGDTALVMNVPAGENYISVFSPIKLSPNTITALVNEGIIESNQVNSGANTLGLRNGFSGTTLKNMALIENEKFHLLVMDFMTRHQISFIEYYYKSYLAGFCKVANQSAFVYIGKNPATAQGSDYLFRGRDSSGREIIAAAIPASLQNTPLYSTYPVLDQTAEESAMTDIVKRFTYVLSQIRVVGVKEAARQLIHQYFSDNEINSLADRSYECTRRY
ncbi:MAG: hypothetical protein K2P92_03285 [Bdellovibrionaceae bacterium]|nr:hypothetical protein [Pseudobdellovibrionaceae bacterium]